MSVHAIPSTSSQTLLPTPSTNTPNTSLNNSASSPSACPSPGWASPWWGPTRRRAGGRSASSPCRASAWSICRGRGRCVCVRFGRCYVGVMGCDPVFRRGNVCRAATLLSDRPYIIITTTQQPTQRTHHDPPPAGGGGEGAERAAGQPRAQRHLPRHPLPAQHQASRQ